MKPDILTPLYLVIVGSFLFVVSPYAQPVIPAKVEKVRQAEVINEVPITGTVKSLHYSLLSASVEGLIDTIHFEIGDHVTKGDLLISMDSQLERLKLQSAKAATHEAQVKQANAARLYNEAERLVQNQNISESEVEDRAAELKMAQAALQRWQADETYQQALVKRHKIYAPFSGVVSSKEIEVGEWASPGTALLRLVDMENLHIDFAIAQKHYPQVDSNTPVQVELPAIPNTSYKAHIKAIVPVSDRSTRTFLLRVIVDEKVAITPGMSARGTLQLGTGQKKVVVSRDALTRYPDGRITVWVVKSQEDKHRVQERRVTVGKSFGNKIAITQGLQPGETVVVRGNNTLQQGQIIKIKN